MKKYLHEWRMRRKIKRILAYNKKHPEQCFRFEDFLRKPMRELAAVKDNAPTGDMTAQDSDALVREMLSMKNCYGRGDSNG